MGRLMDWTVEDDLLMVCSSAPHSQATEEAIPQFVQARVETSDISAEAVEPDPGSSWEGHSSWRWSPLYYVQKEFVFLNNALKSLYYHCVHIDQLGLIQLHIQLVNSCIAAVSHATIRLTKMRYWSAKPMETANLCREVAYSHTWSLFNLLLKFVFCGYYSIYKEVVTTLEF